MLYQKGTVMISLFNSTMASPLPYTTKPAVVSYSLVHVFLASLCSAVSTLQPRSDLFLLVQKVVLHSNLLAAHYMVYLTVVYLCVVMEL